MSLNKDMGDAHEAYLAVLFGGRQTRGSGNQWRDPMDGRTSRKMVRYAFAWDGKSTLAKSISIPLTMLAKAAEQALGERPMIGVRYYRDEKLRVREDWVLVRAEDMAEVLRDANALADILEMVEARKGDTMVSIAEGAHNAGLAQEVEEIMERHR